MDKSSILKQKLTHLAQRKMKIKEFITQRITINPCKKSINILKKLKKI